MARIDLGNPELATMGAQNASGDVFFQLGMMYATGREVDTDLVAAHKWFNLAAMRGNRDAVQHRKDIASELSPEDVASAQQAARDWITTH